MEKDLLDHFRRKLLEEKEKIEKSLNIFFEKNKPGNMDSESSYDQHMAELGSDAREREKSFYFASSEGRYLYHIMEALRRLNSGNYGSCETCGKQINPERLNFVPTARLCIACKNMES